MIKKLKRWLRNKPWLEWEEYNRLIQARDLLHFIDGTAKQSLKNGGM